MKIIERHWSDDEHEIVVGLHCDAHRSDRVDQVVLLTARRKSDGAFVEAAAVQDLFDSARMSYLDSVVVNDDTVERPKRRSLKSKLVALMAEHHDEVAWGELVLNEDGSYYVQVLTKPDKPSEDLR